MKHYRKKISKITDELVSFCYSVGATDIRIHIERDCHNFCIHVDSDYAPQQNLHEDRLESLLNPDDRNVGMAGSYWELVGESDPDDEIQLTIIGQMINRAEVSVENGRLYLTIWKNF